VREAGGYVSEVNGKPFHLDSSSILAGNDTLHPAMVKLLRGV